MKPITILFILGWGLLLMTGAGGCAEQPLQHDDLDPVLKLDTLTAYTYEATAYQAPPDLGHLSKLYFGNQEGFSNLFSLIQVASRSTGNGSILLSSLVDSTILLDSAFFKLTATEDSVQSNGEFQVYYFPGAGDSLFSETESHTGNISWQDLLPLASLIGSRALTTFEPADSGVAPLSGIKIAIPEEVILTLADTLNFNRTFALTTFGDLTEPVSFYSRESDLDPQLIIHYHTETLADTSSDSVTVVTFSKSFIPAGDLTFVKPPAISEMDTSLLAVGRAKGLNTLIYFDLDSVSFPPQTVIRSAKLHLYTDNQDIDTFIPMTGYPLQEPVLFWNFDSRDTDPYSVDNSFSIVSVSEENHITFQIRRVLQAQISGRLKNYGFKLSASLSADPFTITRFVRDEPLEKLPIITVQYVAP